ncbi:MAG: peptidoglycan editing factor PgeF [Methylophilaceae bacterium]
MLNKSDLIIPDWPAPANVKTLQTTRHGGISHAPYDSLNLGDHVQDNPLNVASNRQRLNTFVPSEPLWLNQVHGVVALDAATASCLPSADASYTKARGTVCAVMTADCLPVLLCDEAGTVVAAIHAGWKGLLDGVIESTVNTMHATEPLMAWLGPAIGPNAFEVGSEVREAFISKDSNAARAFVATGDKWLGDMYFLARQRLQQVGVTNVYGGGLCTYTDKENFFSYRRDGATGRMATLIWME